MHFFISTQQLQTNVYHNYYHCLGSCEGSRTIEPHHANRKSLYLLLISLEIVFFTVH